MYVRFLLRTGCFLQVVTAFGASVTPLDCANCSLSSQEYLCIYSYLCFMLRDTWRMITVKMLPPSTISAIRGCFGHKNAGLGHTLVPNPEALRTQLLRFTSQMCQGLCPRVSAGPWVSSGLRPRYLFPRRSVPSACVALGCCTICW